ncbi:MAG TPA: hypothetical protein DCL41_09415 [Bdellovibrionales bacterium]|nr:hypothetical protein [Pseudobdellovibrionaceae bacterium]HAG92079.1 hypothetical protein [Bdellovibrionales bacterium]|tara:strand:- start:299 stop:685 length:387 start_codon:yes stop_codon:yes gene_type:complete
MMNNRRNFLITLLATSACAVIPKTSSNVGYRFRFELIPKNPVNKKFNDPIDFFNFYGIDNSAGALNGFFKKIGWLKHVHVEMGSQKNSVIITKTYKSRFYRHLYSRIWHKGARGNRIESKIYNQIKLT